MAYTKTTWVDQLDTGNKYTITDNPDNTKTIEYAGEITRQGTPMNAENLNHMEQGIADAHSAVSDLETATNTALSGKVDKETGKGLSSNDYTTAEKNKLAGLSNYDDTAVNNAISELQTEKASTDYVNDAINSVSAYYVTYDAAGNPFPTRAALMSATNFYYAGELRTPTKNDYCLVLMDENNDNASCRYVYSKASYETAGHWNLQYIVNNPAFTEAQLAAINSGLTSADKTALDNKVNKTDYATETAYGLVKVDELVNHNSHNPLANAAIAQSLDGKVSKSDLVNAIYADAPDSDGNSQLYKYNLNTETRTNVYPALSPVGSLNWVVPKLPSEASINDDVFLSANAFNSTTPTIARNYNVSGNIIYQNQASSDFYYLWINALKYGIVSIYDAFTLFTVFTISRTNTPENYGFDSSGCGMSTVHTGYAVLKLYFLGSTPTLGIKLLYG